MAEKASTQDALPASSTPQNDVIIASCHCGRTELELPSKPTKLNECQCSVCYKYGAMWGYYTRGDVTVTTTVGTKLDKYVRDDEGADGDISFNRCGHCGCMTHWWGTDPYDGDDHQMGVNCRLLPMSAIEGVERKLGKGPTKESEG